MLASGFAGLGYQIVWTRQAASWLGHDAAAVLAVIAAFFGGLAVGALALGPRIERSRRPERWYAGCEAAIALWSLALALLMAPVGNVLLALTGAVPSLVRQWTVAFVGTFCVLLPATAAMGATLPAMERVIARIGKRGSAIGALYACNTLGAVVGVLATAFWLVPAIGLARTAGLCAALNVACAVVALRLASGQDAAVDPPALPPACHAVGLLALTGLLGTGVTAASAAEDPTLQVDAAELLPEVIAASTHFRRAFAGGADNPRLRLVAADARRFVRTTTSRYDLIVSDNFHPARSGSGALYTVEHFRAVQSRLAAGGVFCQWLPLHQLDLGTLRSIVQTFVAVYPDASALLATNSLETPVLGLVARAGAGRIDPAALRRRLADNALPQRLADFGIADEFALLGGLIAGPRALKTFAGTAVLNTDDRPVVAYAAPRITYAPDSMPGERLLELLRRVDLAPAELIDVDGDAATAQRLAAYWAARDAFIAAGRGVRASADVREMLSQVREPLLSVLHISPDFRPAYDPLLRMAAALGRTDAAASRALLTELVQVQPARLEAVEALRRLAGPPR